MQHERPHVGRILVVDDDRRVRDMLTRYFEEEGFRVGAADSGAAMWERLGESPTDVVLLDLGLPGEDGLAIARELRARSGIGIIMVTGRSDMVDRVVGLEVGADDYIAKPFHLREVLARVKSVLRRLHPAAAAEAPPEDPIGERLSFEGWHLDVAKRQLVTADGADVRLTTGEFDLLLAFASNPNRVLDRDRLVALTRGREWDAFDRSIDTQVSRLRKKLSSGPGHPTLIKSIRGVGYLFAAEVSQG